MTLLAVLAELLDLATYAPSRELNPLVLELGAAAPLAKLLLVVAIVSIAVALGRIPGRRCRRGRMSLLATAILAGVFGAWTNLA